MNIKTCSQMIDWSIWLMAFIKQKSIEKLQDDSDLCHLLAKSVAAIWLWCLSSMTRFLPDCWQQWTQPGSSCQPRMTPASTSGQQRLLDSHHHVLLRFCRFLMFLRINSTFLNWPVIVCVSTKYLFYSAFQLCNKCPH